MTQYYPVQVGRSKQHTPSMYDETPAPTVGEVLVEVAKVVAPGLVGYNWGKSDGYNVGYDNGYKIGHAQGWREGHTVGIQQGWRERDPEVEAVRRERDEARRERDEAKAQLQGRQDLTAAVKDALRQALPPDGWTNLLNDNGSSTP